MLNRIFSKRNLRGFSLMRRKPVPPVFQIPIAESSSEAFTTDVNEMLKLEGTTVYLDTSFLMWLTKVGEQSRAEFFKWVKITCEQRVVVPVWAAHEYITHHVTGTLTDELNESVQKMKSVAGGYSTLRPYMDAPLSTRFKDKDDQRANARSTLANLADLADMLKVWQDTYRENATEVIEFINTHLPDHTTIYSLIDGINILGKDRYDGRIPPGFKDSAKKERISEDSSDGTVAAVGSNRWGDLLLWREVLDLSRRFRTTNIVLLTKDLKNDWQFGGREQPREPELQQIKKSWRPLPLAHPLLGLEASVHANAERFVMLDPVYLGLLIKRHSGSGFEALVDVAIVPDIATGEKEIRKQLKKEFRDRQSAESGADGPVDVDRDNLSEEIPALRRAWLFAKKPLTEQQNVAQLISHISDEGIEAITGQSVSPLDSLSTQELVSLGRHLHQMCLAEELSVETLVDVVLKLQSFTRKTSMAIYLGLLGALYYELSGKIRQRASSPIAEQIFALLESPFATKPIEIVSHFILRGDMLPIWFPKVPVAGPTISLERDTNVTDRVSLGSIVVDGIEVFTPAQSEAGLNLYGKFPAGRASVRELLDVASSIYGFPRNRVVCELDPEKEFELTVTAGFKDHRLVHRNNSEANT